MWEERRAAGPLVRTVWRAEVETPGTFPVVGSEYWGISFIRRADGALAAELDGPRAHVTEVDGHLGESYWGVEMAAHVAIAGVSKDAILGQTVALPVVDGHVELAGARWPVPAWTELEAWVARLATDGGLLVDEDIRRALSGDRVGAGDRTWQRRYRRTAGLTRRQVDQLRRAQHAYVLLQQGVSPAATAAQAGFADQPHLTRALRLIRGQTPAAIIAAHQRR